MANGHLELLEREFAKLKPDDANGVDLILQGPTGSNYEIDASTDLFDWSPVTNFILPGSPFYFSVPPVTNANQGFFRAVMP